MKTLDIVYEINIKRLKDGEKEEDQLETTGPEEWHSGELTAFSFGLIHPRPQTQKASDLKIPMGADTQKAPEKGLQSLDTVQERDNLTRQKTLE